MKKIKRGKILTLIVSLVFVMNIFIGCGNENKVIKDPSGNEVTVPKKMDKIVSMIPSTTEILVGLGLGDKIIATDNYSTDIEGVKSDVTKIDSMNPDVETIISLKPDVVIASEQNKVGGSDPLVSIKDAGIPVVYIQSSNSIKEICDSITFLSEYTNTVKKGEEIVSNINSEVDKVKKIGENIKDKKTVYFEIGPAPNLYTFGNGTFLNEMLDIIGAKNIFEDEKGWVSPSSESIIDKNPDVILTNVNYIENPIKDIETRKGWNTITAVKDKAIYQIDTNSSSRPSQCILKSLKEMAKDIYPDEYKDLQ